MDEAVKDPTGPGEGLWILFTGYWDIMEEFRARLMSCDAVRYDHAM